LRRTTVTHGSSIPTVLIAVSCRRRCPSDVHCLVYRPRRTSGTCRSARWPLRRDGLENVVIGYTFGDAADNLLSTPTENPSQDDCRSRCLAATSQRTHSLSTMTDRHCQSYTAKNNEKATTAPVDAGQVKPRRSYLEGRAG